MGVRLKACGMCGKELWHIAPCFSLYESDVDGKDDAILHLCLTCAEPYSIMNALRA